MPLGRGPWPRGNRACPAADWGRARACVRSSCRRLLCWPALAVAAVDAHRPPLRSMTDARITETLLVLMFAGCVRHAGGDDDQATGLNSRLPRALLFAPLCAGIVACCFHLSAFFFVPSLLPATELTKHLPYIAIFGPSLNHT